MDGMVLLHIFCCLWINPPGILSRRPSVESGTQHRHHASRSDWENSFHYFSHLGSAMDIDTVDSLDDHTVKGHVHLSHEARLMRYLLHKLYHFGVLARPVLNSSDSVHVQFRVALVQILDFDETRQVVVTHVWKSYQWLDEILTWKPEDFRGIHDIRLPPYVAWTPDIVLYNSAADSKQHEAHQELLAVFSNGTIKWIPSAIYKTSCLVDMTNFPFDEQTCNFKFGSWTYDGLKLDLVFLDNTTSIDWNEYIQSVEWDILHDESLLQGRRETRHYQCCGEDPYPELIYTVRLRRRNAFYVVVLVLPCLLLSCLTLVMFWYPPQRPDRTGLGMSLFSSFFVLLLILVQASPPTAQSISLLGVYYCINMILIALSTMLSAIVINMFQHKERRVKVPQILLKCRRRTWFNMFLRFQGVMIQTKYTSEGDKVPLPTSNGIIQTDELGQAFVDWQSLATALDQFFFFIYIICFALALIFAFPR